MESVRLGNAVIHEGAGLGFERFPKVPRLSRKCVITEKIDGTNAQVHVLDDGTVLAGSRSRYITPETDNHGFARWVSEHESELSELGPGRHYGAWWGSGIQRRYGMTENRFSLFNVKRWGPEGARPECCHVVPILAEGNFSLALVNDCLASLDVHGSVASPGFARPEGVMIYHVDAGVMFKKTIVGDEKPKGQP